jgi:2-succinyl-6-hydroxy-2,4-cyclohexadiene-1-carboxylate synthase
VSHLHSERVGTGPTLVLVHGFTQTGRCWGPVADDLSRDHELVLIDAPGHGRSAEIDADLATGGALIADEGGRGTYIGYSMGGRFALHSALDRPDAVERLVLIGATAGLEDADERAARVADDEARAAHIDAMGVESFLDEWLALPLFAGLDDAMACRDERLVNTAEGLAGSLRRAGTGNQVPTWDRLVTLDMPVLVVAGSLDLKFTALGRRLVECIGPNAEFVGIDGAGHTAHLEQHRQFIVELRSWLRRSARDHR